MCALMNTDTFIRRRQLFCETQVWSVLRQTLGEGSVSEGCSEGMAHTADNGIAYNSCAVAARRRETVPCGVDRICSGNSSPRSAASLCPASERLEASSNVADSRVHSRCLGSRTLCLQVRATYVFNSCSAHEFSCVVVISLRVRVYLICA
jgi:hypothetical protein